MSPTARLCLAILLTCLESRYVAGDGMKCPLGNSKHIYERPFDSCPTIFSGSSKEFCCIDLETTSSYCCDQAEFIVKMGIGVVIPVIIGAVVLISLIICCISCLCCSCCPWYRRRHRGTVYGKVQGPSVVHVIGTTAQPNGTVYATTSQPAADIINGVPSYPPPAYTNEVYAKQAPYNPNYPPQ